MRFLVALAIFAASFACLWLAFDMAPNMKWPHTAEEFEAANLIILGLIGKLVGQGLIMSDR
jgi:multisubunit Na+/H+ antiporter MnhB subunit